jgi:hypothetical protein
MVSEPIYRDCMRTEQIREALIKAGMRQKLGVYDQ